MCSEQSVSGATFASTMAGWALSGGHVLGVGELPWSASLFPLGRACGRSAIGGPYPSPHQTGCFDSPSSLRLVQAEARSSKREREGAVEGAPYLHVQKIIKTFWEIS